MSAEATAPGTQAASAVVVALERAWTSIRTHHPDVPQVGVILGAGSEARRGLFKWGHFAAARWHVAGSNRPEVLVSGEGCGAAHLKCWRPCFMRLRMAWPIPARSRTPAVRAVGTTSASPPSPASWAWRSSRTPRPAGPRPASPTSWPIATGTSWPVWRPRYSLWRHTERQMGPTSLPESAGLLLRMWSKAAGRQEHARAGADHLRFVRGTIRTGTSVDLKPSTDWPAP